MSKEIVSLVDKVFADIYKEQLDRNCTDFYPPWLVSLLDVHKDQLKQEITKLLKQEWIAIDCGSWKTNPQYNQDLITLLVGKPRKNLGEHV